MSVSRIHLVPRSRRDLRFASGLVLFTYVTAHLTCHALGLVSLSVAEVALGATAAVWQSLPGTGLLYGAAIVHVGLALIAIYGRRTLRMPPLQGLRIVLGLMMPIALIGHFVGTRYAFERYGIAAEYPRVVTSLWSGGGRGLALGLLAPGWLHGCLGLRFALSSRRAWQRSKTVLFAIALLLPVLAALGFVTMARTVETARLEGRLHLEPVAAQKAEHLQGVKDDLLAGYLGALAFVAFARLARRLDEQRRGGLIRIAYPARTVDVPRGWTVLEASRSHGIAHLSACGGRARCTTCRVRVVGGLAHCPPSSADERRGLERIRAPSDVRLACQLRPTGDIAVEPVLAVEQAHWLRPSTPLPKLVEREAALLGLAVRIGDDNHAPSAHDTFYALEQHRALVEGLIESSGGVLVEGGMRRWFGAYGLAGDGGAAAARAALATADRLLDETQAVAVRLQRELDVPIACVIAVHAGTLVIGRVAVGDVSRHAAVGEAIDTLEALLAEALRQGQRLVRSDRALALAGLAAPVVGAGPAVPATAPPA